MGTNKSSPARHKDKKPSANGQARRGSDAARQRLIAAKNRRLKKLIESWLKDESGYDEETWPWLKKVLEEDQLSGRRLFRD